jgi:hypothetical protein
MAAILCAFCEIADSPPPDRSFRCIIPIRRLSAITCLARLGRNDPSETCAGEATKTFKHLSVMVFPVLIPKGGNILIRGKVFQEIDEGLQLNRQVDIMHPHMGWHRQARRGEV